MQTATFLRLDGRYHEFKLLEGKIESVSYDEGPHYRKRGMQMHPPIRDSDQSRLRARFKLLVKQMTRKWINLDGSL